MRVENQSKDHIVPNKAAVLGKVEGKLKAEYTDLLKNTTTNDLEKMIQRGALVQDAIILPWSIVTKIVTGMERKTFYTTCSKKGESANRVIQEEGADVLLGYTEQGKDGWDIYGALSLTGIVQTVKNALDNNFAQNVPAANVLAFISCRSAKDMDQTLVLNQDLPAFEPWASVVQSGAVKEKDKIYEVDTVCAKKVRGKTRFGQLLMLWALSKQLKSTYYGTALKVVKLANVEKVGGKFNQGFTYHGPPDIGVANLYHDLFKYQRAFPFPPVGDEWHTKWTQEIPGYTKNNTAVGDDYWRNVKSFFDPTKPAPYITEGYTFPYEGVDNTFNREEYWMYRPYPTEAQLETIAAHVIDKIVK